MKTLKLALIHLDIRHGQADRNRAALLTLIRRSTQQGARLIVAPELSLSGYSFDSRAAIAPLVETEDGPTLAAVRDLARQSGSYVCVGLALKDPATGVFTNSAVVADPSGEIVCRYDKINAESGWACPGNPGRNNTFETPWGRVGVLICSDSYHALMPRVTALRGADLLLVPANWPPSGLDPRKLWRVRALENGIRLAACNRTGRDRKMDCRAAVSCFCDPAGNLLFEGSHATSRIFLVDVPLDVRGRLDSTLRRRAMSRRQPRYYHDCYLNLRPIRDLTAFLFLPQPGSLHVSCVVPARHESPGEALRRSIVNAPCQGPHIFILSSPPLSRVEADRIAPVLGWKQAALVTCWKKDPDLSVYGFLSGAGGFVSRHIRTGVHGGDAIPRMDFGPLRLHGLPFDALEHPEPALCAAKQGCDLIVTCHDNLTPRDRRLGGARTLEGVAVAACSPVNAGIWVPPEGHGQWEETFAEAGEPCRAELDTRRIRTRFFQDNIDFQVLLDGNPQPPEAGRPRVTCKEHGKGIRDFPQIGAFRRHG